MRVGSVFDAMQQRRSMHLLGLMLFLAVGPLGAELPDPTQPAAGPPVRPGRSAEVNWVLSLIKITASERTAVLNGRLVREGDVIDSAQIVRIGPASVVLRRDGQRREVKLAGQPVKRHGARLTDSAQQPRVRQR
jgi:hypothetical protein